ncbi:MAG: (4Fe-4S)-binding protein [Deltaproteobacteria bacterium]|nr:MAG: (4Fe-4S)-binding protein [Deltaproteobacteria bacterium]
MANKTVKVIKINADECNGCRACEAICSAFHATPKYGTTNPAKARIHVNWDPLRNLYVPVYGGPYVEAECLGRDRYVIGEKEYDECLFCRAVACPSRDLFKDPDSGLPLRCDMCEDDPSLKEPMCVQVCLVDALTYEEREEEMEEEKEKLDELEMGLETLIDKYGFDKVADTLARISISKQAET